LAALLAVIAFAAAVALTFPWGQLVRLLARRAAADAGLGIRFERAGIARRGLLVTGLEVECAACVSTAEGLRLEVDRLVATPSAWGLLTGRRGIPWRARARLYGGTADLTLGGGPESLEISLTFTDIDLARLPLARPGTIAQGIGTGEVVMTHAAQASPPTAGRWRLRAREIRASGLVAGRLPLPVVAIARLVSSGTWTGPRVEVTDLAAEGSFGDLRLAGRVLLREPTEASAINARMTYRPPERAPPEIAVLLGLLLPPGARESRQSYRLAGTLAAPMVTPAAGR
jgi:type II secretion system protein N